jgi:hypothetical protein
MFELRTIRVPFLKVKSAVILCLLAEAFLSACSDGDQKRGDTLFAEMSPEVTGVDFVNKLEFDQDFNIYTYRNFYNGGGVGLGDINNDGLVDMYLISNQGTNRLFLNKGDFKFEDITERAGVGGTKAWSTGVALADVNGDGWLDIYVCNSGDVKGDDKENELFINNRDLTFTEQAEQYGLADKGFTTHAVFFDYDLDSDLDLYVLNNSYQAIGSFNLRKNERPKRDALGGDKLMRNDGDHFTDVSENAGIYGSVIGFGLGVTVGDIDKDGWPDLYVSNDFFERDYLYINNHDGTFRETLTDQLKSISGASMGADLGDINNDTWPDLFVTEMLPQSNARIKTVTTFENWDRYRYNVENDYYHQFTRNVLQLNNGDNSFSEIGRLAGVEATDWSWGALMFDMDNDGFKDLFVANGIYQDLTNQDYLQYISNEEIVRSIVTRGKVDYAKLVELIPSTPVPDYAFRNLGGLHFENHADEWGLGEPNFSNGAAYGDLDNDGDLDLVVNRVNSSASVFKNRSRELNSHHYLKFVLVGSGMNTSAIGTRITVTKGADRYYMEQMPNRGFESSVDHRLNLGLGGLESVDSVIVQWPDQKVTTLTGVTTNQVLTLKQAEAIPPRAQTPRQATLYSQMISPPAVYEHLENQFVDFDRDKLIYHMISTEGPRLGVADINGDGLDDFYIGGAKDSPGAMFIQLPNGKFKRSNEAVLEADKVSEDLAITFFDADNDKDMDLYVCSGGTELGASSSGLVDRLYFNDGVGNFTKSAQILPAGQFESTTGVKASDFDKDGDIDLFVGVRVLPFQYGMKGNGYLLQNDGKGNFKDVSATVAPGLKGIGMITDASWADIDGDGDDDLLIVGEYMPISVFVNDNGHLSDKTSAAGLGRSNGWWNRIVPADVDMDGDIDFIAANHGLNSRFRASPEKPVCMYVSDFDRNGTVEQLTCVYNGDKSYPVVLRHDLVAQIPSLKKKYLKYEYYRDQTIEEIFSPEELASATKLEAFDLASSLVINEGGGRFVLRPLPTEAQLSVMYAIQVSDFDKDGNSDIMMGGNLYSVKPEAGRYDASYGVLLKGNGKGDFAYVRPASSGLVFDGEVRDMASIKVNGKELLMVARNNAGLLFFTINRK